MSYANRQYARLKSALHFYRKREFSGQELADKAGTLAIRLLAIDRVHKEEIGIPIYPPKLREALLRLVMVTEPDQEDDSGKTKEGGD